jgi:Ala-tRNA(Pro) deacylase
MPELEGFPRLPRDRPMTSPEELLAYLAALGIETATVEHPPLFTVEQSRSLRGQIAGGHTKNLFLKDKKDRLFLVVAEEDAKIELKHLHNLIGAQGRLSFGKAELLRDVLGVEPGSVTPFAAINDRAALVRVVLDQDDASSAAQLSSARQYAHHHDRRRRSRPFPERDRA